MPNLKGWENPDPHRQRKNWKNLNVPWAFEIDNGCIGESQGLFDYVTREPKLDMTIISEINKRKAAVKD